MMWKREKHLLLFGCILFILAFATAVNLGVAATQHTTQTTQITQTQLVVGRQCTYTSVLCVCVCVCMCVCVMCAPRLSLISAPFLEALEVKLDLERACGAPS